MKQPNLVKIKGKDKTSFFKKSVKKTSKTTSFSKGHNLTIFSKGQRENQLKRHFFLKVSGKTITTTIISKGQRIKTIKTFLLKVSKIDKAKIFPRRSVEKRIKEFFF